MRKNILILFILFFFSLKGYDQNLVLNADFEQFHCAPWYISSIEDCDHWSNPTMNSPDYFNNDCKENKTSAVPDLNWWGYQLPQSGNSYAGFFAYRPTNNKQEESIAEYIEAELSSPLKANEKYIIKLHVSLAECSTFALNKLEVYFSENKIKEKTVLLLKYNPQVESHVNINDTAKWVTVEETFIAKGNEQYMTIGCFNTGKKIKYSKVDHSKAIKEPRGEAYYFIDNVSVVPELTNETPISKDESAKTVSSSGNENIHSGSKATESKTIIYFDPNEHELKKHSIHLLDSISNFLLTSKDYQISINGYCDNSGEEAKNQILSEERAGSVSSYLKNKNIPSQFITSKGFAANDPIATNDNEAGKAKNRRVEIIININTPILVQPVKAPISDPVVVPVLDPAPAAINEKRESFNAGSSIKDLEVGKILILENLNFEGGTAVLLPEAKPTLELLVKTLKANPTVEIEIGGHVCCANDMPLSVLRAKSVYNYLIKKGIDESRLTYKGYSRSKPIYEDDRGAFEARANRRVEITVLKK